MHLDIDGSDAQGCSASPLPCAAGNGHLSEGWLCGRRVYRDGLERENGDMGLDRTHAIFDDHGSCGGAHGGMILNVSLLSRKATAAPWTAAADDTRNCHKWHSCQTPPPRPSALLTRPPQATPDSPIRFRMAPQFFLDVCHVLQHVAIVPRYSRIYQRILAY
ncbi:hypothetical protein PYCCODRAFT_1430432 [Trametes coccinea BRFM310]|uniref:Uncharacterized protein n=1 Tax=Trametes coccinea (strain BRFM310) TaxID=1353009 RepID=A0A1Y2J307_TRAC3|nr:hypothetical protein PYCCODRAFT_1430432 [Trametes coccinea BRFM310]